MVENAKAENAAGVTVLYSISSYTS